MKVNVGVGGKPFFFKPFFIYLSFFFSLDFDFFFFNFMHLFNIIKFDYGYNMKVNVGVGGNHFSTFNKGYKPLKIQIKLYLS